MSLSRLELVGFKSFMSPITIQFRGGITAILGPNGCGKTNIVDAVRWVLGEQSPRQLRSNKMENVIFNGTQVHKPTGYAQVNMTIDNVKGVFPLDYSEITISRKVYRSGISEYFINKSPCRLKDIRELFADTGTGSHSYAVIEQEMIDYVLNDIHGERRQMFEETAGIVKYRMRREEARRKLKLTENDLVRLEDILEELGKQVRSLRYQVGKAKRHNTLKDRIRSWELVLIRQDLSNLVAERRELEKQLAAAHDCSQHEHASLGETEKHVEQQRFDLLSMENKHRELQNKRYEERRTLQEFEERTIQLTERRGEAERMIERAGREIGEATLRLEKIAERIADVSASCESLEGEIERKRSVIVTLETEYAEVRDVAGGLGERLMELKQTQLDFLQDQVRARSTLEHFEEVLSGIDSRSGEMRDKILVLEKNVRERESVRTIKETELEELNDQLVGAEKERERINGSIRALDETLAGREQSLSHKQAEYARLRSRHELLSRMRENFEGFPSGARHVLTKGDARVKGSLVDLLMVDEKYLSALEAVLGGLQDGVVVERLEDAITLVSELVSQNLGRVRLFVQYPGPVDETPARKEYAGSLGRLSEFVSIGGEGSTLVESLLGAVYIFATVEEAQEFMRTGEGRHCDAVTLSGVYFCRGKGIYFTGSGEEEISLLGRMEEIHRIADSIDTLQKEIDRLEAQRREGREEKESLVVKMEELETVIAGLREKFAAKREELREVEREHIARREQRSHMLQTLEEMEESRMDILSKLEEKRLTLQMQQGAGEISEVDECSSQLAEAQRRRVEIEGNLTEMKIACASLRGDVEKKREEVKGLREMETQFSAIIEQRNREIAASREETTRLEEEIDAGRGAVKELLEKERSCQGELDALTGVLEEKNGAIARMEKDLKAQQAERERMFARENELKLSLNTLETRMNALIEKGVEVYGENLHCYLDGMEVTLDDEERKVTREMLDREKRKLEGLGAVNLAAVDEYEEKRERFEFLNAQKEDLVSAKRELEEAIVKINRRARRLFIEMFEMVRGHFSETFQVLFEGGEASLSLGEGSDPLEADIIISARPKGKRLQEISLLSGGERALTAMALLFALYKAKPSPFCIFDEVDAPLDEANIGRFVKMLTEFQKDTQFIIITHNKRTMEVANFLYGVTMEEKGVSRVVSVDLTEIEEVLSRQKPTAKAYAESTVSSN